MKNRNTGKKLVLSSVLITLLCCGSFSIGIGACHLYNLNLSKNEVRHFSAKEKINTDVSQTTVKLPLPLKKSAPSLSAESDVLKCDYIHFPKMKTKANKNYKNALYRYDYLQRDLGIVDRVCSPKQGNIGDDIQSLAALQFLPTEEYLTVARDNFKRYDGEPVNLVANAWYRLSEANESFSSKINPLLISIHLDQKILSENSVKFFKKYEPIGCRDLYTMELFRQYGIKAFFSGCLTLTLGEKYTAPKNEKTDEIIFVDVNMKKLPDNIRSPLEKHLKKYDLSKVSSWGHMRSFDIDRSAEAERLLKRYARAKLVVTSRLHVALPCLAMGTPVILVRTKKKPDNRFGGLIQFVNFVGYGEFGEFIDHVLTDSDGYIKNDTQHLPYVRELKRTVQEFFN